MKKIRLACRKVIYLANEASQAVELFLCNQLTPPPKEGEHWVQLSPFGDFGNHNGGKPVIQRFRKEDGDNIANSFNSRPFWQGMGMPFYIGHPDHPSFRGKPGHTDTSSYGRGKEMAVRHDAACANCQLFANAAGDPEAAPCPEHGLFVRMDWSEDGRHILSNAKFHGHSVLWGAVPDGTEKGVPVVRPVKVKSAGFTNEPNIAVKPASLANASSDGENPASMKVQAPPFIKLAAGFKEDEDKTIEECEEALKTAKIVTGKTSGDKANEAAEALIDCLLLCNAKDDDEGKKFEADLHAKLGTDPKGGKEAIMAALEKKLPDAEAVAKVRSARKASEKTDKDHYEARNKLEQQMANERQSHAKDVIDLLIKMGKLNVDNAPAALVKLSQAGDKFTEIANSFTRGHARVYSASLSTAQIALVENERERSMKFQQLMDARAKEFPNEAYEDRFRTVSNSNEGTQLFAQMKKAGATAE